MQKDPAINYIEQVMSDKGWSATALARKAGISPSTITRQLTGKAVSSLGRQTLLKIEKCSGIKSPTFGVFDKPSKKATPPGQKSGQVLRAQVTRMTAVEDIPSGRVAVSLDAHDENGQPLDEVKLLLTYEAAVRGYRTLQLAVDRLDASSSAKIS